MVFRTTVSSLIRRDRSHTAEFLLIVIGSVVLATLVRFALSPFLGLTGAAYVIYFIAVLYASWRLGIRGGAITSVLSIVVGTILFLRPTGQHHDWKSTQYFDVIVVLVEWLAIAALGQSQLNQHSMAMLSARVAEEKSLALQQSEQHLRFATEGANIGTWHWNVTTRNLTYSEKMKELFGGSGFDPAGNDAFMEAIHPDDREVVRTAIRVGIEAKTDFDIEIRVVWPEGSVRWLVVRGHCNRDELGVPASLEGIAIDITSRKYAEQDAEARVTRANSLNTIGKAIREMREPKAIQDIAMVELARTLNVDRCLVILLDKKRDWVSFVSEWHRDGLPDLRGDYSLADFDIDLGEIFAQSLPLVIPDMAAAMDVSPKTVAMLRSLQIEALVDVPMSRAGEIVSVLGVYMAHVARYWSPDEVLFVESVASQLNAAIESDRVLSEAQNRAEREALVNQISATMRTTVDPEDIQARTVEQLGRALGADRCYFAVYDLANGEVVIAKDWHRRDLPSVAGVHRFVNTQAMFKELYPTDATSIIADRENAGLSGQTIENMKALQIRSRISVAIADAKGMATLTACMADEPYEWDPRDIELIEKVASQLRPTVEMARARQREHRIATDLQAALLPAVPDRIPGLQLGTCMQPALDEAEIGGDFFDVFPLDKCRYALVVGDVSGKGLAAAGQLATVRNSLRMCLYQHQGAAAAVSALNTVLVSYDLIVGFVTAFVCIFDAAFRSITYACCGHEPPLLRRGKDGVVEMLHAEGLPLGVSENANYGEATLALDEGDCLFLYTDGLSESGPSRSRLLGAGGLIDIFSQCAGPPDITEVAAAIVTEAQIRAGTSFRDDVCVLLARVTTR